MNDGKAARPKVMLIAVDTSDNSKKIVMDAAMMAHALSYDVHIISVVRLPKFVASEEEINMQDISREEDAVLRHMKGLIDEYFRDPNILVESSVLHGDPVNKICEYADISHVDLIVVGSRGSGRLKRLLGSVSEGVSRNARCSVLIVR
jgi:nucleotide-binding universal stress UspA family protein